MLQPEQIKFASRSEPVEATPSVTNAGSVVPIFILASLYLAYQLML